MARNPIRADPTRTGLIREAFERDMRSRWVALAAAVKQLVETENVFGIKPKPTVNTRQRWSPGVGTRLVVQKDQPTTNADSQWAWTTNNDKLKLFAQWLQGQIDAKILTIPSGSTPWTAQYITSAYRKGLVRAYTQMHSEALAEDSDVYKGTQAQFLDAAFAAPVAADKVKLLATRSFESLKGVSATASQQMNQILAQGLIDGSSPGDIANDMTDRISSLTDTRALLIAQTEVIYAHAEGQLDMFKRLGVDKVGVEAEWLTAGDSAVCPECQANEGLVMDVDDAHGLIPLHPRCRCMWIPANVGEDDTGQGGAFSGGADDGGDDSAEGEDTPDQIDDLNEETADAEA